MVSITHKEHIRFLFLRINMNSSVVSHRVTMTDTATLMMLNDQDVTLRYIAVDDNTNDIDDLTK